ncbi:jg611, partial [Pararge aegeria aegeria]
SLDTSTDRPYEPIKMTEMRVRSEIALRYARTSVITHVHNPDMRPQEASFHMLLPDSAFISGFTMIIDGKSYKAFVKGKQEAKQMYTQAVSQGSGAAHIATNTDRPYEPIKMTEMRVRSEIALRYARTSVITHVHNPDMRPQEASFHMLLPDSAFISGFTMCV